MTQSCYIWDIPATLHPTSRDGAHVNSARTDGEYFVSRSAVPRIKLFGDLEKVRLTTWLVDQRRLGTPCPEISTEVVDRLKGARPLQVEERADRLLIHLRDQTPRVSTPFSLARQRLDRQTSSWVEDHTFSRAKAWTESLEWDEVFYFLEFLEVSEFLRREKFLKGQISEGPFSGRSDYYEAVITPKGHAHIADLEGRRADSKQAFIAMWFHESMNEVYDAIADAVRGAGYQPLRIDRTEHNNKIDDEIIAEIRRSRFLVADFTHGTEGMRGGVYYEAGFARGMGLEVISTCRNDLLTDQKIHFDTRQYNHIGWTKGDLAKFKSAVSNRIAATIGDGPLKLTS